jgi:hypothetical protein
MNGLPVSGGLFVFTGGFAMSDFARLMEIAIANDPAAAAAAMGTPEVDEEAEAAAEKARHDMLARYTEMETEEHRRGAMVGEPAAARAAHDAAEEKARHAGAMGPTGATGHAAAPEHRGERGKS